ncbi:GNAT family N-acetyltransferase [Chitinophaga vietnamensis]|uniref:GNAT family N-acetyltransferase n=1 Tax=Chitinophaga vietnamensis TaxID=2593957 RepID=UPI00117742A1|nr:GNAT family N-acetyltransferase [Chitinophaga vietnamensis]
MNEVAIKAAASAAEYQQARMLFEEYAASLPFDLAYQDFQKELAEIDQQYHQPEGALLLCRVDGEAAGCVAVRRFAEGVAELKRLYVKPAYRNLKLGKRLLESAINTARELQYDFIRLDTVPGQAKAQDLYRFLGFYEIAPYRFSPIEHTIYMEMKL